MSMIVDNSKSQSFDNDSVEVEQCQVCGRHKVRRLVMVFNRGRNMYGLPDGTVVCVSCVTRHQMWMMEHDQWTGNWMTTQPQEIHAESFEQRMSRISHDQ